jgi:hypothetical protein
LLEIVLRAYKDEYIELYSIWRNLETKAQGTIVMAGIFLAGLFTLMKDPLPPIAWQRWLLGFSAITLGTSAFMASLVQRVRSRVSPQFGIPVEALAEDLLSRVTNPDELVSRLTGFVGDQVEMWKNSVSQFQLAVDKRADSLWRAQFVLGVAMVGIVLVSVLRITNVAITSHP